MQITREIRKKVYEEYGVSYFQNETIAVELTDKEIEEAYRIRSEEYLKEDVKNAIVEFCELHEIPEGIANETKSNPVIIDRIAKLHEKNSSIEVAYSDTMNDSIREIFKEVGIWKKN